MKFLDDNGLLYLWQKIKNKISNTSQVLTNSVVGYTGDTIPEGYEEIEMPTDEIINLIRQYNTYSTEEIWIGYWFGRKLYRKCFEVPALTAGQIYRINPNISNLKEIVRYGGSCKDKSYGFPLPHVVTSSWHARIYHEFGNNTISVASENQGISSGYAIIEYTKTTD